jgi:hypothetical protein
MQLRRLITLCLLLTSLLIASALQAQDENSTAWPREIEVPQGLIVLYQPQPERLDGDRLYGRAAVGLETGSGGELVFGAIWFDARLVTDRDERSAIFDDIKITRVRFPNQDETKAQKLTAMLEAELPKRQLPIDLDNLIATLETVEARGEIAKNLSNEPPRILFVNEPAILISIDGEPQFREEEGIERVINTPFTIIRSSQSEQWYLNADADHWYSAAKITGDWQLQESVPEEIEALAPEPPETDEGTGQQDDQSDDVDVDEDSGPAPRVIVVTEPTELISSIGKPEFTPISGTDLLYVSNTDSDVLMDINKQKYYVLLSGRWYTSKSTEGPWAFTPGDQLPEDFRSIPEESDMAIVRYAVPGTEEAEEAVLDAQMPQTAAIDRDKASLSVEYDGEPKFEAIEGTKLTYAINTATPVIAFGGNYYAVDEAVWFVAEKPTGKWVVALNVPDEIYTIPVESPLYYVTFVRIYGSTPEVVYVGYTQGYTNVYVTNNTIVYGTGYWYPGWYGRYYYPRPSTWGFHVRYNPRWGWSFGLSYSTGPFTFYIGRGGWYRGGWWGPGRYRSYHRGYRHGRRAGYRAGYRAGKRNSARNNMYRSQRNQARTQPVKSQSGMQAQSRASTNRDNNIYTDRDGNVHRNTDKGWEQRTEKGWSQESAQNKQQGSQQQKQKASQQKQKSSGSGSNRQQLNKSQQSRKLGNQRAQQRNSGKRRR